MSDQIPFHIQEEIIKRLPVKSLVQFRSVCKAWKCLIDSSEFIAAHSLTQTHHHLLVTCLDPEEYVEKYVSFMDDDTFPLKRFVAIVPLSAKDLFCLRLVGCSQGLLCSNGYDRKADNGIYFPGAETAVLWNPSVRKSIAVLVPQMKPKELSRSHETVLGFGVCPATGDPKMVQITQFPSSLMKTETDKHCKVKIYKLSTGKWRNLPGAMSSKSVRVEGHQVVIGRFIYWSAWHMMTKDGGSLTHNLIMSFDLTNENFIAVDLPDSLASQTISECMISISKLRDSLAMVESRMDNGEYVRVVWMMDNGNQNSFTMLFTIKEPFGSIQTLGFRKSGEPLIEVESDSDPSEKSKLVVYEPNLDKISDLKICGSIDSFLVNSFVETLLLLTQTDCSSY